MNCHTTQDLQMLLHKIWSLGFIQFSCTDITGERRVGFCRMNPKKIIMIQLIYFKKIDCHISFIHKRHAVFSQAFVYFQFWSEILNDGSLNKWKKHKYIAKKLEINRFKGKQFCFCNLKLPPVIWKHLFQNKEKKFFSIISISYKSKT